jgi:hypothetical protein
MSYAHISFIPLLFCDGLISQCMQSTLIKLSLLILSPSHKFHSRSRLDYGEDEIARADLKDFWTRNRQNRS